MAESISSTRFAQARPARRARVTTTPMEILASLLTVGLPLFP
jgi:hypothetical protein